VPLTWGDVHLFTLLTEPFSLAALAIFIIQILLSITWPTFLVANTGIGQVITPNTHERGKLYSFHSIISSFWPSIVTIGFPLLAIITKQGYETGQQNILSYRVWFPVYAVSSFLLSLFSYFNCKERIIVEKDYKPKIKFSHGMKSLSTNKYFWIAILSGAFGMIRVAGNLQNWINVYALKSDIGTSISTTLLGNAMVPGMLLTGFMVRKFGKKNLMLFTGFGSTLLYIPMAMFPQFPIFLMTMIFLQNMFAGLAICAAIMPADALDYQQLKTGERLEGFWGMFSQLMLAVFWLGGGLIGPAVLEASGMTGDPDFLFPINRIRYAVFRNFAIMSGIACFFQTVPYLFWDLSEQKHKEIIDQLAIIAKEKNGISKIS
jgi:Na+/melibiose symporter-like transporter